MARLTLCLLGPFQAALDGEPVTGFATNKVRALLAYLAVEAGQAHNREKLAGLLWPDQPERLARTNLRSALAKLRKTIRDGEADTPLLLISRHTLQFNPEAGAHVDAARFASLVSPVADRPLPVLERAVALYRGPFLEGFSLPDSPHFEEWALFERERLHRLQMEALHKLAEAYETRGDLDQALVHTWCQLELDPSCEAAHSRAMRLLALSGRQDAALAQFQTCQQRLAQDLDVEPCSTTLDLYEQIRNGDVCAPVASMVPPKPPHNLPAPLTPFIGRQAELAEIAKRLDDPGCRLLTFLGPGGVGKTRLALEAAHGRLVDFPDGVFQVGLVGVASSPGILPAIAAAVGCRFHREGDIRGQLLNYLRSRTMLLLLDNYEHLPNGAGLVADILRAAPWVRIVVTSRARLHLKGENLFPVDGMALPPLDANEGPGGAAGMGLSRPGTEDTAGPLSGPEPTANIARYDAIQLFLSGAQRVCPGFELEAHTHDVARICHKVGGMPLALLLASAWVGAMSPARIAAQLSDDAGHSLDLLEAGWDDVPERHRTMRAVFEHSWRLLPARLQTLFGILSVFRGGFSEGAAREVARASLRDLVALVDRSFVQRLAGPSTGLPSTALSAGGARGRYEVHELMRQYGAEWLASDPAAHDAANQRHCAYYAARLEGWGEDLKGERQLLALDELREDWGNARAAWDWAVERRRVSCLDQALNGLCSFYEWRARCQEGEETCRRAAEQIGPGATGDEALLLVRLWTWQAAFHRMLGRTKTAQQLLGGVQQHLASAPLKGMDARRERAAAALERARSVYDTDRQEAQRCSAETVDLYREAGDRWGMGCALVKLAHVHWLLGRYQEAAGHASSALEILRDLGDRRGMAMAFSVLGVARGSLGHGQEQLRLLGASLGLRRELGNPADIAYGLGEYGGALGWRGRFSEALPVHRESLDQATELGLKHTIAHRAANLADTALHLGQYREAAALALRGRDMGREIGYPRGEAIACWTLGREAIATGAYSRAKRHFSRMVAAVQEIGLSPGESAACSAAQAHAELRLEDHDRARRHLVEALRQTVQGGIDIGMAESLPIVALFFGEKGQVERAVEVYALASQDPYVANSRWFAEVIGRHITSAAESLPPDAVAAARERGRSREPMATVQEILEELEAWIEEDAGRPDTQEHAAE